MARTLKPGAKGRAKPTTKSGKAKAKAAAKKAASPQLDVEAAIKERENEAGQQEATEQQIATFMKRLDSQDQLIERAQTEVKAAQQTVRERKASRKAIVESLERLNVPKEAIEYVAGHKALPPEALDRLHRHISRIFKAVGVPISHPIGLFDQVTGKTVATAIEEAQATGNGRHPAFKDDKEAEAYWLKEATRHGTEAGLAGKPASTGDNLTGKFRKAFREAWMQAQATNVAGMAPGESKRVN